jgi:DNA invertase Pin-like site-specific DNA recombinase
MPLAISYWRFSSKGQGRGDSTDRQDEKFQQALRDLKEHDLEPGEIYFDKGCSAFRGKHRGELGRILANLARFPKGTWLIIESFSRLTRQGIDETQELIRQIVRGGLTLYIVDHKLILNRAALGEIGPVVIIAVEAFRAWQASREKSDWSSQQWKRALARATPEKPAAHKVPNWIQVVGRTLDNGGRSVGGTFELIPERVAIIKEIHRMKQAGQGEWTIWRWLVNNHKPFNKKCKAGGPPRWSTSSVNHLLRSRALIGEWLKGDGTVVKGYYPAAVSKSEFEKTQSTYVRSDQFKGGETGQLVTNLFQGLAFDLAGRSMVVKQGAVVDGKRTKRLCSSGGDTQGFRYSIFEEQFLKLTKELTIADIGRTVESSSELQAVERELVQVEAHYLELKKALSDLGGNVRGIAQQMLSDENSLKILADKRDKLKAAQHLSTAEESLANCRNIHLGLHKLKGKDLHDARLRLRTAIRGLVNKLTMKVTRKGWETTLACRIEFASGHQRYLMITVRRGWATPKVNGDSEKWIGQRSEQFMQLPLRVTKAG